MQQLVENFEQANLKIRKEVEDLRDYSTQLLVKAQKYDEAARVYSSQIYILNSFVLREKN